MKKFSVIINVDSCSCSCYITYIFVSYPVREILGVYSIVFDQFTVVVVESIQRIYNGIWVECDMNLLDT